jgi:hypothetical protein
MPFDCREVFCIAPALQLFQYHATGKQVPHASCGKMTSSSPPSRRLPLPYQKHGYCRVPFAFLSFRMSLLSPRTRAFCHGMCALRVLLTCFILCEYTSNHSGKIFKWKNVSYLLNFLHIFSN